MKLEQCFKMYEENEQLDILSFHQIRDWYNERTKDGITSARLINLLRKRPQFQYQHTERKSAQMRLSPTGHWVRRKFYQTLLKAGLL